MSSQSNLNEHVYNEETFPLSRVIDELHDYDPVMPAAHWEYVCQRAAEEIERALPVKETEPTKASDAQQLLSDDRLSKLIAMLGDHRPGGMWADIHLGLMELSNRRAAVTDQQTKDEE